MKTDSVNLKIIKDITQATNKKYKSKLKHPLTDEQILAIVDYQYICAADCIQNREFIELPMFGRFFVKEGKDKHIEPEKRFYEPHMKDCNSSTASNDTDNVSLNI